MAGPLAIGIIIAAAGAAAAGGGFTYQAQREQARAYNDQARYQRELARYYDAAARVRAENAKNEKLAAEHAARQEMMNRREQARVERMAKRRNRASMEAATAASGIVMQGSPVEVMAEQRRADEEDVRGRDLASAQKQLIALWQGEVALVRGMNESRAIGYEAHLARVQGANLASAGRSTKRAAPWNAAAAGLQSGGAVMSFLAPPIGGAMTAGGTIFQTIGAGIGGDPGAMPSGLQWQQVGQAATQFIPGPQTPRDPNKANVIPAKRGGALGPVGGHTPHNGYMMGPEPPGRIR